MKQPTSPLPSALRAAQHDIDHWRASNERRRQIPESFWQRATELAQHHSLNRVAVAMRLSHKGLRARLEANKQSQQSATARFVELPTSKPSSSPPTGHGGLTLQLHDGADRTMKIVGADPHSAASVIRTFFGEVAR
jgi:hypothetical protein